MLLPDNLCSQPWYLCVLRLGTGGGIVDGLFYPLAMEGKQRLPFLWQFIDIKVMIWKLKAGRSHLFPLLPLPEQQSIAPKSSLPDVLFFFLREFSEIKLAQGFSDTAVGLYRHMVLQICERE